MSGPMKEGPRAIVLLELRRGLERAIAECDAMPFGNLEQLRGELISWRSMIDKHVREISEVG